MRWEWGSAALAGTLSSERRVVAELEAHGIQPVQGDEGIRIHGYESDLMQGFPSPADRRVTSTSYSSSREHRVWAHQHMCELCTTQQISRGTGEVRVLPRDHRELDDFLVTGSKGTKVRLTDLLRESFTDAFLVLRDGVIINEQYFSGMRPDTRHHLWSASKSISVGVVFNLLQEGIFQESSLVTDVIPELGESGYRGATIRHLMDMQSGVEYDYQENDPLRNPVDLSVSNKEGGRHFRAAGFYPRRPDENPNEGQYEFFKTLKASGNRTHGSMFYYKCCDTAVLGWACEKATGRRFADLVGDYVWSKIGAERDGYIVSDVQGGCSPNAGMSMTLRDLGRSGPGSRGEWRLERSAGLSRKQHRERADEARPIDDQARVVPAKDMLLPNTAYRSQFWIPGVQRDAFYAGAHTASSAMSIQRRRR